MAETEYATIGEYEQIEEAIEATVAYTVLVEPVLPVLRRLAHEDVSSRLHYGVRDRDGDGVRDGVRDREGDGDRRGQAT
jgi:hypothetical protein